MSLCSQPHCNTNDLANVQLKHTNDLLRRNKAQTRSFCKVLSCCEHRLESSEQKVFRLDSAEKCIVTLAGIQWLLKTDNLVIQYFVSKYNIS